MKKSGLVLLLGWLAAVGCSDSGGSGAPGTFGATACYQCIASHCSTQVSACNADATCQMILACFTSCPVKNSHEIDEGCADKCTTNSTNAVFDPLAQCNEETTQSDVCEASCDD